MLAGRGRPVAEQPAASGESTSTLSPQSVLPFHGALPVATTRSPFAGSTAAPLRDQIAESLDAARARHDQRVPVRAQRVPDVRDAPVDSNIVTTWPWYGGASPM